ncbi:AzlD domain-containing protein [Syntrophobacter fumaroxidans]|uniref:Branched-chain amino acid transport n=1 Tax=Syntrophobacter fumaroxidans (strain DSM 10017 / MPOB) TaxID=335543 RepID=A0LEP5_SYNFM|nr:AzlD domain-containing protein [Syntrophobacter fumaroxidans]ABK15897.1 branched-chain amino acid transport [Syntrophobacter fumaroxidans MPOB]
MPETEYLLLVAGMGLVTYLLRWVPLFFFSRMVLPRGLVEWLDLIPVSIMSALVFPDLLTSGAPKHLDLFQVKSIVAVPTLLFAFKTKSPGGTVLVGMLLYWLAGRL